ncbi:hypothetical protein rosag_27790 [Roseisolibacter agri]|uniref:DUF2339 domain-containing protein n=2 Tax=Roseisolibacter agri TaxID=2014610 RepID=A0AA37QAT8_9BACT|nr:hypothetical protein rosag_27790 [Roseisolibacter agri]
MRLGLGPVPADGAELEALVGRYGTVALAVLLILMGLGAFLTWAIAAVTLTPTTRVALGAVGAAALAAGGWRLRVRDEGGGTGTRRFGDVLLALALAAVHVDAWGAGPALGLVSAGVALAIAAAASGAVAFLAWRERDQALFVVGVGGAVVAPFVTGADTGHAMVLAPYGWLVLSAGVLALPHGNDTDAHARPVRWRLAARVLGIGGALLASALLRDATAVAAIGNPAGIWLPAWQLRRELPVLFALACAVVPLALPGRARRAGVALMHLTTALGAITTLALATRLGAPMLAAYAFAATLGALVAVRCLVPVDRPPSRGARRDAVLGGLALPLALLVAALLALPDATSPAGGLVALAWAAGSALAAGLAARRPHASASPLLGAHVAAAGLAGAIAPLLGFEGRVVLKTVALSAYAAACALLLGPVRQRLAALPSLAAAGLAAASAAMLLSERPAFAYAPFLTSASLAAAAVVVALTVLAWRVRRDGAAVFTRGERTALAALPALAALAWGREELARAGSPELSTFLLVGYFAAAGVAALAVGRARRVAGARQVGLALAIYAALKALAQASELRSVGLRVGSYLLVGAFLLAVGYWYRSAGERASGTQIRPASP